MPSTGYRLIISDAIKTQKELITSISDLLLI